MTGLYPKRPRHLGIATIALLMVGCVHDAAGRARQAIDRGEYEVAARILREEAERRPSDVGVWMSIGRAELLAERPARARDAFTQAAVLAPDSPEPRIRIGHTHELEHRYDEAELAYRQATEVAPESARAFRVLGTRLLRWDRAADALVALERARALAPDHVETWNATAMALASADRVDDAVALFREGMARFPSADRLALGLAALELRRGGLVEALAVYRGLLEGPRPTPAVAVGAAIILDALGRTDEALAHFERAAALSDHAFEYEARLLAYRRRLEGARDRGGRAD